MEEIKKIENKEGFISLSNLKEIIKKSMIEIKEMNANKIEKNALKNINKIINNSNLSTLDLFLNYFNYKSKNYYIKEQYSYMRCLYSYLTQLLSENKILIVKDDIISLKSKEINDKNSSCTIENCSNILNNEQKEIKIEKDEYNNHDNTITELKK